MLRTLNTLALAAALALAAGCATTSPDVVSRSDAQRMSSVTDAVVLSTRPVVVDGTQSGIGATSGAVVGGVAGSSVGGHREAIAVGVIGNVTERLTTLEDALEILVQLRNGERRAIVQAKGAETFAPGEPVLLVATGGRVRVMKAPGAGAAPAPVAPQSDRPG